MAKQKRYIAMIETHSGNQREQWAEGKDGHSLSSSGRWTDAKLHSKKKDAEKQAKSLAAGFRESENAQPFVRTVEIESPISSMRRKSSTTQITNKTPAQGKSATSFAVKCGRTSKTFATKKEAKEYASAQSKGKTVNITESTKKPTHKIVKFTAKR